LENFEKKRNKTTANFSPQKNVVTALVGTLKPSCCNVVEQLPGKEDGEPALFCCLYIYFTVDFNL
jgi:hypothetical protein